MSAANFAHDKSKDGDILPILLRAYVPVPTEEPKKNGGKSKLAQPSEWSLIFDCETTIDATQNLRFGTYQLRKGRKLIEAGIFYEPEIQSGAEKDLLGKVAAKRGIELRTREDFVESVFFDRAYDLRANIIGFNLPFDLSRLIIKEPGSAKGKTMAGGFSLQLSNKPWRPRVQIRHLNSRAALIQFSLPPKQRNSRGARRRGIFMPGRRGSFIDLKTIAAALFSRSFSLASLAEFLKTSSRKFETEAHGAALTEAYIGYALQDTQVTWECYEALSEKYALHQLSDTSLSKILSEASLGKAYLRQMGVKPFREVQPDFPPELLGSIMSAYFGGRSEVAWRREIKQVLYCDFLSMYPTVCTLMGLWRFVIAEGMSWHDVTEETRALVEKLEISQLQDPANWRNLTTLVRVRPGKDIFPIRAKYDALMPGARETGNAATIGLNVLSADSPLWFTLADVLASKLLTGKPPEILEAFHFEPLEPQKGLKRISVTGNPAYRVDPYRDDLFKRVIELRTSVKQELKSAGARMKDPLKAEEQALKILANSTSYGIFVEMIVRDLTKAEDRLCYGPSGSAFSVHTAKEEEPGRYFHPLLATLITGAARLMLAIAERRVADEGLDWAFCDTDSMAIAKPESMESAEFFEAASRVREWFDALNPYVHKGPLFKIEDANYRLGSKDLAPLYCLAISAKRYALFNLDDQGKPVIRKASAHGLGHLLAPYKEEDAPASIPAPAASLSEIGVDRWQYDLWFQIISATLAGNPDEVDLSYYPALEKPAASRYGATSPDLLRWFKTYNKARPLLEQVKPFNFLLVFQAKGKITLSPEQEVAHPKKGRRPKAREIKPVAPFDQDPIRASQSAFDRDSSARVSQEDLKTYRQALAGYHLSAEPKFENGDHFDRGRTRRRHIKASATIHIGKEANKWEEQYFTGLDLEEELEYGSAHDSQALDRRLCSFVTSRGEREAAHHLGIARDTLRKALKGGWGSLSLKTAALAARRLLNGAAPRCIKKAK
jgi:hypothetical protein